MSKTLKLLAAAIIVHQAGLTIAWATPSDNCNPADVRPNGPWEDISLPVPLEGNWYNWNIWMVGVHPDRFIAESRTWDILAIQGLDGYTRLVVYHPTRGYRAVYYLILNGALDTSQACLVQTFRTLDYPSAKKAMLADPGAEFGDLLASTTTGTADGVPWTSIGSPPNGLRGEWINAGSGQVVEIGTDSVIIDGVTWTTLRTAVRCEGPELEEIYRLVLFNATSGEYQARYYRCLQGSSLVLETVSRVESSEDVARRDRGVTWLWYRLIMRPLSVETRSWAGLKALYR